MEFAFLDRALRTICESDSKARNHLGDEAAEALQARLADIRAANNIADLLVGKPRVVRNGTAYAVDIVDGVALVFQANHVRHSPVDENGQIDWPKVSRIKFLMIEVGSE